MKHLLFCFLFMTVLIACDKEQVPLECSLEGEWRQDEDNLITYVKFAEDSMTTNSTSSGPCLTDAFHMYSEGYYLKNDSLFVGSSKRGTQLTFKCDCNKLETSFYNGYRFYNSTLTRIVDFPIECDE